MTPQADEAQDTYIKTDIGTDPNWKMEIVWRNVLIYCALHSGALYGLYLFIFSSQWRTNLWSVGYGHLMVMGLTAGSHRLYTHKSYKATFPVKIMLLIFHAALGQNSMMTWVRDHRQHHKYTDTDADPHNAARGLFFSHAGWLLVRKHPAVIAYGKKMDISDLKADPLIVWQKKYFKPLYLAFSVALPIAVPMYFWHETFLNSVFNAFLFRYVLVLNLTWMINSVAHKYGTRPYNKDILATDGDAWYSYFTVGEQCHNFHHCFPRDYRGAELGLKLNITTMFIEILLFLGLVYDLRTVSDEAIRQRILKTGDGSYRVNGNMLKLLAEE